MFGTCSLITTLVCLAFQPETRGASLEDVDGAFDQSPWRSLIQNTPFSGLSRITSASGGQQSNALDQAQADGNVDEFELDEVHLPQVSFGGPWHYAHRLTDPRLSGLVQVQDNAAWDEPLA